MTLIAIALDTADIGHAEQIAAATADHVDVAKVGLQLYSAHGPAAVERIRATGLDVFADLKLHDIPNTVGGAATEVGRLGARFLTIHAAGGREMADAAYEGFMSGNAAVGNGGGTSPMILTVTQLTSLPPLSGAEMERLIGEVAFGRAVEGLVCSVSDVPVVRAAQPGAFVVTPGIRPAGVDANDQKRVASPAEAVTAGADMIVVGRAITAAADPADAAAAIRREMDGVAADP